MENQIIIVSELISLLKKLPKEIPVLVTGYESGYDTFKLSTGKVVYDPDAAEYDGRYQDTAEYDRMYRNVEGSRPKHIIDVVLLERPGYCS